MKAARFESEIRQRTEYSHSSGVTLSKDPDIFSLDEDPLKWRGRMSCGHSVLARTLAQYVGIEVSKRKTEIRCPYVDPIDPRLVCGKVWSFAEIKKMVMLPQPALGELEKKLSENKVLMLKDVLQCPTCKAYLDIGGHKTNRVPCLSCQILNKKTEICRLCARKWKPAKADIDSCAYDDCGQDYRGKLLKQLEPFKFKRKNLNIPKYRACPNCGIIIEISTEAEACKSLKCVCGTIFCMICLSYASGVIEGDSFPCFEKDDNNVDSITEKQKTCSLAGTQTEAPLLKL